VCYQGEPGAYSEKSLRELLGSGVISVARKSFEDCFKAVSNREAEYCLLPVENSLGGSIHENYDLMLRYDLHIVAEHDFRVKHCYLKHKDAKTEDIKFAISHPQALAQCQNYLRARGITPIGTYDTAGSAKMLATDSKDLPDGCTPQNTMAIASDLAGVTYGLDCVDESIEDDDSNFTRFLLLSRDSVSHLLTSKIKSKTSIVFTLPESAGALYKALACFSLRDVDFSKIESRPTSASLLQYLRFKSTNPNTTLPRFRYCFYLDFLENELSKSSQNSLNHLKEQSKFVRVLGSYPSNSKLIGPIKSQVASTNNNKPGSSILNLDSDKATPPLRIGFIGYNNKIRHLASKLSSKHTVTFLDNSQTTLDAVKKDGHNGYEMYESGSFLNDVDVVIIGSPLISFGDSLTSLPLDKLKNKLVVSLTPLLSHPKSVLSNMYPPNSDGPDIVCANAMVDSATNDISGAQFVYEKVRVSNTRRCDDFVKIFNDARMKVVELDSDSHDQFTASSQFITSLIGRLLNKQNLKPSPVNTRGYENLERVVDEVGYEDDEEFYALWKYADGSTDQMKRVRDALSDLEKQLSAKDSYEKARSETKGSENQKMLGEVQRIVREAMMAEKRVSSSSPNSSNNNETKRTSTEKKKANNRK
jgi:prephenate dehydratase/prephenate dehydrogenase